MYILVFSCYKYSYSTQWEVFHFWAATSSPRRWKVNLWRTYRSAWPPTVVLFFKAVLCFLVNCEGQRCRGTPGESGMSQAVSFSREKLWDLVLLEENSRERAGPGCFKLSAVSSILMSGKLYPPGCVLLSCAVVCWGCLPCSMCSTLIAESRWPVINGTRRNWSLKRWLRRTFYCFTPDLNQSI